MASKAWTSMNLGSTSPTLPKSIWKSMFGSASITRAARRVSSMPGILRSPVNGSMV